MDYKLAKSLKDRGFIQYGRNQDGYVSTENGDDIYVPLLEEVIEACGDKFKSLRLHHSKRGDNPDYKWQVWARQSKAKFFDVWGSTPLEAVCRLFLSLNPESIGDKVAKQLDQEFFVDPFVKPIEIEDNPKKD